MKGVCHDTQHSVAADTGNSGRNTNPRETEVAELYCRRISYFIRDTGFNLVSPPHGRSAEPGSVPKYKSFALADREISVRCAGDKRKKRLSNENNNPKEKSWAQTCSWKKSNPKAYLI
jgi:hypothetical protein